LGIKSGATLPILLSILAKSFLCIASPIWYITAIAKRNKTKKPKAVYSGSEKRPTPRKKEALTL
jgi:hypothetical protein